MKKSAVRETEIMKLDNFFDFFRLVASQTIGYGQFSRTVLATSEHNKSQNWAVKMIEFDKEMDETDKDRLKIAFNNEVKIISQLNHPFIASRCIVAECPSYLAICRHYYSHGCLQDQLKVITDDKAERYLAHVGSALGYLHRKRIAHSDVKMRNILINASDQAVLADFSLSFEVPEGVSEVSEFGGTLGYVAPEVFTEPSADPFKVDVYAMGVVLWCMVLRRRPKHNLDYLDVVNKTLLIPHRLRIALHMLLHPEPAQRTAMDNFMNRLTTGTLLEEFKEKLKEETTEEMDDIDGDCDEMW
ncbi:hypothetical protein Btru_018525 [Bulinus truncatus]|nr:hypothetical protein Btru_018525 [Bulinus truncatus]